MKKHLNTTKGSPTLAEKLANREVVLEQIRALLAMRNLTALDAADALNLNRTTVYAYFVYLAELGEAHKTGERDGQKRALWAAGRAPVKEEGGQEELAAKTVPAVQIGMKRDPLAEALFGPARGAAA
jgi:hypothetical protein